MSCHIRWQEALRDSPSLLPPVGAARQEGYAPRYEPAGIDDRREWAALVLQVVATLAAAIAARRSVVGVSQAESR